MQLQGRQTQFYIDLIYGLGFAVGFGYLLVYGMNLAVVSFSAGLMLGYFLRVWEKMIVYERILQEEVAAEAEQVVAEEAEAVIAEEAEETVADEVIAEVEKQVPEAMSDQIEEQLDEEMEERVAQEVEEQMDDRSPARCSRRKRRE
jgi:adenylosuccinate lyase